MQRYEVRRYLSYLSNAWDGYGYGWGWEVRTCTSYFVLPCPVAWPCPGMGRYLLHRAGETGAEVHAPMLRLDATRGDIRKKAEIPKNTMPTYELS